MNPEHTLCVVILAVVLACVLAYCDWMSNRLSYRIVQFRDDASDLYPIRIYVRGGVRGNVMRMLRNLAPPRALSMRELWYLLGVQAPLKQSIDGHVTFVGSGEVICFMQKHDAQEFIGRVVRLCRSRVPDNKNPETVEKYTSDLRVGRLANDDDYATKSKHQRQIESADQALRDMGGR